MRSLAWWLLMAVAASAAPSTQEAPGFVSRQIESPRLLTAQVVARAAAVPQATTALQGTSSRSTPARSVAGYAIQPPGQFHGGEAIARDGETWLALRADPEEAALLPATLRVSVVEDPLLDAPGERTGASVSAALPDDAFRMFLRGPGLVAGVVETARVDLANGRNVHRFARALSFRGARYRLRSECTPRGGVPVAGQWRFDCRIVLREMDTRRDQVLVRMGGYASGPGEQARLGDDAAPELLFAGDLDRDGELDLLFDTSHHDNLSRPSLFLSSQARPGELLREVAAYEATGC